MDKKVLDYVVEKTKELMGTATCSAEAKAAAQAWLDAVGTAAEAGETKKYIAELEGDIMTLICSLISPSLTLEKRISARTRPPGSRLTAERSRRRERNSATVRPVRW